MPEQDDWWWNDTGNADRYRTDAVSILAERGVNIGQELPREILHEVLRVVSLIWMDGQIIPSERFAIDPADEGLLFGRGLWESTRTSGGVPWLWNWHLERLKRSAGLLGIPLNTAKLPTTEQVSDYVRRLTKSDVVLRLNATAGRPGRPGVIWMTAALMPMHPESVRLMSLPNPIRQEQPHLMLKTFQYATRLHIGQQASLKGFDSALLVGPDDTLHEAAHANIFIRRADGWVTPRENGMFLPGTVRFYLLQNSPLKVTEANIARAELETAREVFLTNSNFGIMPVTQIDNITFPIGPETRQLQQWIMPQAPAGLQLRFNERLTPRR